MIRTLILLLFLCSAFYGFSQQSTNYPKDYFRSPLDIPLLLSGNFGELRNNHFHSGLDIKTQ
ncbi:MAG: M23 family peptidase, partial [Flavobacteriales bacterium]|nr:M23 family peptidase [Flavobacteriales bacterium]